MQNNAINTTLITSYNAHLITIMASILQLHTSYDDMQSQQRKRTLTHNYVTHGDRRCQMLLIYSIFTTIRNVTCDVLIVFGNVRPVSHCFLFVRCGLLGQYNHATAWTCTIQHLTYSEQSGTARALPHTISMSYFYTSFCTINAHYTQCTRTYVVWRLHGSHCEKQSSAFTSSLSNRINERLLSHAISSASPSASYELASFITCIFLVPWYHMRCI